MKSVTKRSFTEQNKHISHINMTLHILCATVVCILGFLLSDLIHIFLVWALGKEIREIIQLNETNTHTHLKFCYHEKHN